MYKDVLVIISKKNTLAFRSHFILRWMNIPLYKGQESKCMGVLACENNVWEDLVKMNRHPVICTAGNFTRKCSNICPCVKSSVCEHAQT